MTNFLRLELLLALAALGCATTPAAPGPTTPPPEAPKAGCTVSPTAGDAPDPAAMQAPPDVAAPPADATKTPNGIWMKLLQPGCGGAHPGTFSVVRVHYTGWTTDGRMFDSSLQRGEPTEFPLSNVILGWRYGLKAMVVGEKRRFWIPPALAYEGQSGPQGMLVFDVELLEIVQP